MLPSALDQVQRIGLPRNNQQWRFSKHSPWLGGSGQWETAAAQGGGLLGGRTA